MNASLKKVIQALGVMPVGRQAVEDAIASAIYTTLQSQKFFDWYADDGTFGQHISGDLPTVPKEKILADIKKMFQIA